MGIEPIKKYENFVRPKLDLTGGDKIYHQQMQETLKKIAQETSDNKTETVDLSNLTKPIPGGLKIPEKRIKLKMTEEEAKKFMPTGRADVEPTIKQTEDGKSVIEMVQVEDGQKLEHANNESMPNIAYYGKKNEYSDLKKAFEKIERIKSANESYANMTEEELEQEMLDNPRGTGDKGIVVFDDMDDCISNKYFQEYYSEQDENTQQKIRDNFRKNGGNLDAAVLNTMSDKELDDFMIYHNFGEKAYEYTEAHDDAMRTQQIYTVLSEQSKNDKKAKEYLEQLRNDLRNNPIEDVFENNYQGKYGYLVNPSIIAQAELKPELTAYPTDGIRVSTYPVGIDHTTNTPYIDGLPIIRGVDEVIDNIQDKLGL